MDASTSDMTLRNDKSGLHPCWSCKGPVSESDLFCETCQAVQPPGQIDHFARLGLHKSYDIDVDGLERTYFELQRHLHPDRFAKKTPQEKSLSQQQAVSLNEAFETLKDPLLRADYLLQVLGETGISHDHTVNDPALLMEAMETREALMEADNVDVINKLTTKARRDVRDCVKAIATAFAGQNLDEARKLALRLKYLTKLLEETRQHKARLVMK
ncbi:Fe-S protein assembly co-chaperone HscB [Terasakiella sp. A23]|uniref:Fe-S protein assembly co-chaperone HscB n=1 Tax=Terasakiella sp. FCG-A23 TaxID=3080561 RepID=UPI002955AE9D|nr:Fe-S protein assembly co-chaperone HscB [Terasakiella sp. A23]MDV7339432.1 Fe-S protein assembly co-chaperone HscB [Terasakiella sp. A23]